MGIQKNPFRFRVWSEFYPLQKHLQLQIIMARVELGKKIAFYDTVESAQKGREDENWITILHGFTHSYMILHQKKGRILLME